MEELRSALAIVVMVALLERGEKNGRKNLMCNRVMPMCKLKKYHIN